MTEAKKFSTICMYAMRTYMKKSLTTNLFSKYLEAKGDQYIIESVGPFLWRFRDAITEGKLQAFIDHDYKDQIADWMNLPILGIAEIANKMCDIIKDSIATQIKVNQDNAIVLAKQMLATYARYLMAQRAK